MRRALLVTAFALLALPSFVEGQERQCDIDAPGRTEQRVEAGDTVIVLYDPFTVLCDDGARLEANSGRLFRASRELLLVGDVFFRDEARTLSAGEATYNADTGRLWAIDEVVFENLQDRSTLRGPELEYLRASETRPLALVDATRRPTLTLPAGDDPEAEPLELTGDRVQIEGEDDLLALGDVVITRSDLDATAAEARYNSSTEELELLRNALIVSDEFSLAGELVRARLVAGDLEEVRSTTNARLEGEDLEVTAPELHLFFAAELLERAIARGGEAEGRAHAVSRTFALVADSIDAGFVEQRIEIVHAVGSARGETIDTTAALPTAGAPGVAATDAPVTLPRTADPGFPIPELPAPAEPAEPGDTLLVTPAVEEPRPAILASDWIVGDTITGYFGVEEPAAEEVAALEPGAEPEEPETVLRRLVARGSAQSLYRVAAQGEEGDARRNVNFLVGDEIELELAGGELQVASVEGLQRGIYLEAVPPEESEEVGEPAEVETGDPPAAPVILGARATGGES